MVLDVRNSDRDARYMTRRGPTVRVLLDGKPIPLTFYADGRRAVVRAYAPNAKGHPYLDANGEIVTVELRGRRARWVWP